MNTRDYLLISLGSSSAIAGGGIGLNMPLVAIVFGLLALGILLILD